MRGTYAAVMAGSGYAHGTSVSVGRSRDELERLLRTRGATGFVSGWDDTSTSHMVMFRLADRMFRLSLPRADPAAHQRTPTGRPRPAAAARQAAEAEERRLWRALLLVVKARLVAVDDGVETLETAFLPWVVLPDGTTVAEWLAPQLDAVYATAQMPQLLPGPTRPALPAPPR